MKPAAVIACRPTLTGSTIRAVPPFALDAVDRDDRARARARRRRCVPPPEPRRRPRSCPAAPNPTSPARPRAPVRAGRRRAAGAGPSALGARHLSRQLASRFAYKREVQPASRSDSCSLFSGTSGQGRLDAVSRVLADVGARERDRVAPAGAFGAERLGRKRRNGTFGCWPWARRRRSIGESAKSSVAKGPAGTSMAHAGRPPRGRGGHHVVVRVRPGLELRRPPRRLPHRPRSRVRGASTRRPADAAECSRIATIRGRWPRSARPVTAKTSASATSRSIRSRRRARSMAGTAIFVAPIWW